MTDDLLTQLERYGNVIDEAVPIFDFEGIETGDMVVAGHLQPEPSIRVWQQRGWVVAAASFGVVLLVGGATALIMAQQGGSPPATETSVPVVTVTVIPTPSPTTVAPPPTTAAPTETTTTSPEPVLTAPVTGCNGDEYLAFLSRNGKECDLVQGEEVPPVFGPLLDGGWFDLTELRGRPAVVLTWVASYGPGNRDALAEFQILYDKWSDQIGFVSMSEDTAGVARQTIEAGDFTFPVVTCISDLGVDGTEILCGPIEDELLWVWWGNQDLPSWIVLDSEGRFVDIRLGGKTTIDDIDSLLASAVASEPDS